MCYRSITTSTANFTTPTVKLPSVNKEEMETLFNQYMSDCMTLEQYSDIVSKVIQVKKANEEAATAVSELYNQMNTIPPEVRNLLWSSNHE